MEALLAYVRTVESSMLESEQTRVPLGSEQTGAFASSSAGVIYELD